MMKADQDSMYQYSDGHGLLNTTLTQQMQLVNSAKGTRSAENMAALHVIRAQTLLFEFSVIGDQIDSLISELNGYAERGDRIAYR